MAVQLHDLQLKLAIQNECLQVYHLHITHNYLIYALLPNPAVHEKPQ